MSHHHGDVGRFDEWAPTYERHWMQRFLFTPVQRTVLDLVAAEVATPKSLLDVGCGTGRLLRSAQVRFPAARLDGVDAAAGMVKQARLSAGADSPINFQEATAEALPFANASFDAVMSTLTFHHWADQAKGIAEVSRVLAPGGRWVLADFVAGGFTAVITGFVHAHGFPERNRLDAMLAASGLSVVAGRSVWRTLGNIRVLAIAASNSGALLP
jgi:ubiquinone/menaquinone biosynthesis C-methylase UbiE